MILESPEDSDFDDARNSNYPIVTTPMIAGQRDYPIGVSENVLKIKRVDTTYDGINWYRAERIDIDAFDYGVGNDTLLDNNFIPEAPRFDIKYNSIWLYPMPNATQVAAGGKIRAEWDRQITVFTTSDYTTDPTDSTVIPGFDAPFHMMLAYGAAYEWALTNNYPQLQVIAQELADWETRLRQHYNRKDLDQRIRFDLAYQDYR